MMNDRPVLRRQNAPAHRPGFWDDLDAAMTEPGSQTSTLPAQIATPDAGQTASQHVDRRSEPRRGSRSIWPLVAAAAVLAVAGLGMLFLRGSSDPGTEIVAGPETGDMSVADAPPTGGDGDAEIDADQTSVPVPTMTSVDSEADSDGTGTVAAESATTEADASGATEVDEAPAPPDLSSLDVPTYVTAAGNRDTRLFTPTQPFVDGTRFLGTWEEQQLSWFSLADIEADCTHPRHSTLRYVDSGGFDLPASDPQVRFAGNASNFAFNDRYLAWLAECNGRIALFVASQSGIPGQLLDPRPAWIGPGSDTAALVSWEGSVVSLSSFTDAGEPFFVNVDMESRIVSGSGVSSEVGPDTGYDSWIVGAAPNGTTWWNTTQTADSTSCDGRTLTRFTETDGWESPFVEPVDVGAVNAFALNPELAMVAFSDACPGLDEAGFFIGTLRADGLISSVRAIDLSAYISGNVFLLDWIDPLTLRIHTEHVLLDGLTVRFEYVFDDGRDAGVLVLLD